MVKDPIFEAQKSLNQSKISEKNALSTFLQSLEQKNAGIAYGGRGPRKPLKHRVSLDKKGEYAQYEQHYFQYPVSMTNNSQESGSNHHPNLSSRRVNAGIYGAGVTMSPVPTPNTMTAPHSGRVTPDLIIDGT